MTKKKEWAWAKSPFGEECFGPFPSRRDAMRNAKENCDDEEVLLGICYWPRAADHVPVDYDGILEQLEEHAVDSAFFDNGEPIFMCTNEEKARKDLTIILMRWAKKWLEPTAWTFRSGKKVKIR